MKTLAHSFGWGGSGECFGVGVLLRRLHVLVKLVLYFNVLAIVCHPVGEPATSLATMWVGASTSVSGNSTSKQCVCKSQIEIEIE